MKFPALAFLSTLAMITCDAAPCGENFRRISASACEACGTNAGTIDAEQTEGSDETFCQCAINEKVADGPICTTCLNGKVKATRVEVKASNVGGTCDAAPCVENFRRNNANPPVCVACGTNGGTLAAESTAGVEETFCKCTVDQKVTTGPICSACDGDLVKTVALEVKDANIGTCDEAQVESDKCGTESSLLRNSTDCLKISVFTDVVCGIAAGTPVYYVEKDTKITIEIFEFTFNCTGDELQVGYDSAATTAASATFAFTTCHKFGAISATFEGVCTSEPVVTPPTTSPAVTVTAGLASSFLVFAMLQ